MEDFYTAGMILNKMALFGVFDGHGGTGVAEFCARNFLSDTQARVLESEEGLHKGLHTSFLKMDECLRPLYEQHQSTAAALAGGREDEDEDEESPPCPGSTIVVAVVDYENQRVVVTNVDDSRAILSRNGRAVDLARPQEPEDAVERARIEAAGVETLPTRYISTLDKASTLGMWRSIGDFEFKMDAARSLQPEATGSHCSPRDHGGEAGRVRGVFAAHV
ncbi:hypothetical protein GOP47_0006513 [Adiantum capillus-veneris]|uniref:protein-serine/threonine phosphatase n=1 Tax=Adiantum capillus-veneris TaxID=13818 RepID=A0A9D4V3T8_ADICA|nr:hypothetical protein GOP47_0006513 [Adiantum capillus-veneris]